jgi:hypothetical protein
LSITFYQQSRSSSLNEQDKPTTMQAVYEISDATEQDVWNQLADDLANDILEYAVILKQDGNTTALQIDIDPGGGFEGGYAFTSLIAPVANPTDFKFAIHHEGFLDEVGKFLGMQDVKIGHAEFDDNVIVKTNDEEQVKKIFNQDSARNIFINLTDYNMHISRHPEPQLKLEIEDGITDVNKLRSIYNSFYAVLLAVNKLDENGIV